MKSQYFLPVVALTAIVPFNAVAAAQAATNSPVIVLAADKMRVSPLTRFCIFTEASPATIAAIAASGESFSAARVDGWSVQTALLFAATLEGKGFSKYISVNGSELPRVMALSSRSDVEKCRASGNSVTVIQTVVAHGGQAGYKISFDATQGSRHFSAAIERWSFIYIDNAQRDMLQDDATSLYNGKPFWDAWHDYRQLSRLTVNDILSR